MDIFPSVIMEMKVYICQVASIFSYKNIGIMLQFCGNPCKLGLLPLTYHHSCLKGCYW